MTAAALEGDDSAEGEPRGGGAALRPGRPSRRRRSGWSRWAPGSWRSRSGPTARCCGARRARTRSGVPAQAVDTTGAGDVVTGVLTAALSNSGFSPQAAADALGSAMTAAARATEGWGALDSLPEVMPTR